MTNQRRFIVMQLLIWGVLFMFMFIHTHQRYSSFVISFSNAGIGMGFYAAAIYLHSNFLFPRFYEKGRVITHVVVSLLAVAVLVALRMVIENKIMFQLLDRPFYSLDRSHFFFTFYTITLAFLVGILVRASFNYIHLLKAQEELKSRHLQTELNLLKSQVQPHFLFNTLNNIYYLALTNSEKTPETIARLSDIMRYFVDQAPKERVALDVEIAFLRNYIALEQIRMRYPAEIALKTQPGIEQIQVPPMLLIPFVENIFKHGVDKTRSVNSAEMKLETVESTLTFTAVNTVYNGSHQAEAGTGLENLGKRLQLLFGNNYTLTTNEENGYYRALLQIPVK